MFLYIDPLKQGLKQNYKEIENGEVKLFLYIDPLKQGLKLCMRSVPVLLEPPFLYIDPLKQGLKHLLTDNYKRRKNGFYT